MQTLSLDGPWHLTNVMDHETIEAQVPGCVHTDLIAAKRLPDLWWRDNEAQYQWPWQQSWRYERRFTLDQSFLDHPVIRLSAAGLDTMAEVRINGVVVLNVNNMHRHWEAAVHTALRLGDNHISIDFAGEAEFAKSGDRSFHLPAWNLYADDYAGKSYLRKMACAFGWDWGPMAPTAGIWRSIGLHAYGPARWEQVCLSQDHQPNGQIAITVKPHLIADGGHGELRQRITIAHPAGNRQTLTISAGTTTKLNVDKPQLWWPNGMGEQPLYQLSVDLVDNNDEVIDHWQRRIGLRQLQLERIQDDHGESFRFVVNNRRVFAKGANWIPCDVFIPRITDDTYRHLLQSAAESHMNMIRVWGGGIYEQDIFYDLCDELGLLVWQDFMFACSTYPTFDQNFLDSCRQEAVDNVRRLRHHPCMALWCGNNEIEQGLVSDAGWNERSMSWPDYERLFDQLLPQVVAEEDPQGTYWPCSPHSPAGDRAHFNNPTCGDAHAWSVWFGGQPFEAQREWGFRFMSEFGFQSFPEPRTIASFTEAEDRNLTSWIMDFHQRSGPGNQTIFKYLLDWFRMPKDFANTLWMTQLTQALCIQYAAEHARRIQGQMDGLLYWQLNDMWPAATWSSIDVHGRWKALQFLAKRFFAPVLVSVLEDRAASTMTIHCSNHLAESFSGHLHWQVMGFDGDVRRSGEQAFQAASQSNTVLCSLELSDLRRSDRADAYRQPLEIRNSPHAPLNSDRDWLLVAWVVDSQGREHSRNLGFFARPKHWLLQQPDIQRSAQRIAANRWLITLSCAVLAPWTRLELDELAGDGCSEGRLSDNFVHLIPGLPVHLELRTSAYQDAESLLRDVTITPLVDVA